MQSIKSITRNRLLALCKYLALAGFAVLLSGCPLDKPVVEGPIAGNPTLIGTTLFLNLADVGYQQSEYFISGSAASYVANGELNSDGKWSVREADRANYKTRFVVYRPIDPARFNGTVIFEWLNVSGGTEASSEWIMAHNELIRKGYAWVGVSVQKAGLEGGGADLGGISLPLKWISPLRYASLVHPGDKYAYDIFSQVAGAVLKPAKIDPLGGLRAERAIASGESQSADFLVTYVNAIAPVSKIFDGYFIHSRLHGSAGLDPVPLTGSIIEAFAKRATVHVRDDLDVPVMMLQTETDLFVLGAYPDRQPDSKNFRLWEVAGTAHADIYTALIGMFDQGTDPNLAAVVEVAAPIPGVIDCGKPLNSGPHHFVTSAAIAALDSWVRHGLAPAYAERLEVDAETSTFVKDSIGNVLGGVRTPYVDVPVATLSGEGQSGSVLCQLFGTTKLLDSTQLAGLYPDHATFVTAVDNSVDNAVSQGFLLPPDGDLIKTWARLSGYGDH